MDTNQLTISDLSKTVKESDLPASKAEALESAFMPFFEAAARHCETAFTIKVSNIGQTAEMGRARAERLALKATTDPESLVIQRSVGLTKKQWKKLGKEAARKIRGLVDAMPENESTS